mgnify:CR=1 FL=1
MKLEIAVPKISGQAGSLKPRPRNDGRGRDGARSTDVAKYDLIWSVLEI